MREQWVFGVAKDARGVREQPTIDESTFRVRAVSEAEALAVRAAMTGTRRREAEAWGLLAGMAVLCPDKIVVQW